MLITYLNGYGERRTVEASDYRYTAQCIKQHGGQVLSAEIDRNQQVQQKPSGFLAGNKGKTPKMQ